MTVMQKENMPNAGVNLKGIPMPACIDGWRFRGGTGSQDYFAQKTGFTQKPLGSDLMQNGFSQVFVRELPVNVVAVAFVRKSAGWVCGLLGIEV